MACQASTEYDTIWVSETGDHHAVNDITITVNSGLSNSLLLAFTGWMVIFVNLAYDIEILTVSIISSLKTKFLDRDCKEKRFVFRDLCVEFFMPHVCTCY